MPSHPSAKKVLKKNRKKAEPMPAFWLPASEYFVEIVSATIPKLMPAAPQSMSFLRPTFSMIAMAMSEARKYSVPLQAVSNDGRKPLRPIVV